MAKRSTKKKVVKRVKRKKLVPISTLKNKLWELCKQIVRIRDGNVCTTCKKFISKKSDMHTGHFVASAAGGLFLRYDIRNLHVQCYHCNVNLGGNAAEYYPALEKRYGRMFVDDIRADKNVTVGNEREFLQERIELYELLLKNKDAVWEGMRIHPDEYTMMTRSELYD